MVIRSDGRVGDRDKASFVLRTLAVVEFKCFVFFARENHTPHQCFTKCRGIT